MRVPSVAVVDVHTPPVVIFSTELVVPHDLPRGVSPQLGVFVGAEWDDVEFDISGIPIGKSKKR